MALKPCRECGREVSTEAAACPHCGAVDPTGSAAQLPVTTKRSGNGCAWSVLVVAGLAAVCYAAGSGTSATPGTSSEATASAAGTGGGDAAPFGMYVWAGRDAIVRRQPRKSAAEVRRPGRGERLTIALDTAGPSWYAVLGGSAADTTGYVHSSGVRFARPQPIDIETWTWYRDPDFGTRGAVVWTAVVRNDTPDYVERVRVDFTSYDARGNVVDTDFGYATGLSPGGTGSAKGYATYFGTEARADARVVRR